MNLGELDTALRKLRLSGMATVLEARLRQAQSERQTRTSNPPVNSLTWVTARPSGSQPGRVRFEHPVRVYQTTVDGRVAGRQHA